MKKIILFTIIFSTSLCLEEITEHHENGMPKVVKSYSSYGKLELAKETGYYSNGTKQYEKTYKNGQVKDVERWDKEGKKYPSMNALNMSISGKWIPVGIVENLLLSEGLPDLIELVAYEFKNSMITVFNIIKDKKGTFNYSFIDQDGDSYLLIDESEYTKIEFSSNDIMRVTSVELDKDENLVQKAKIFDLVRINKIPSNLEDAKKIAIMSKGKLKAYYNKILDKANTKEAETMIKTIVKSAEEYYMNQGEFPEGCLEKMIEEGYIESSLINETWNFECLWKWSEQTGVVGSIIAKTSSQNDAGLGIFIKYNISENTFSGTGRGY